MLALRGATVLDPARFAVTVVTGSGDTLIARARDAGIEVLVEPSLVAPIAPVQDQRALRRLRELFEERSFDVVHTHCSKAGVLGRLAAHRAGTAAIVHTYHGFGFHQFQSAIQRGAYVRIERRLGSLTDVALCVGNGVAVEALRRRLLSPERIRTIGVALDDDVTAGASLGAWDATARRRARAAHGLPQDATVVGAVGRLTYQKAPEDFVGAIDRLSRPDVVGVWIGDGELADAVGRLAGRLRVGRVVLAGERHDVLDLLAAFDCFALPSRYEGLPTALVEAMVCGVPVVATAVNAVPDLVVHGQTGLLVPPLRPDLLAAAIRRILDEPTEATRMAANARVHVGDRFSERALREVLSSTYQACVRSRRQVSTPS
jgi:glycosyltransferase involved in cell wall biosynthesis